MGSGSALPPGRTQRSLIFGTFGARTCHVRTRPTVPGRVTRSCTTAPLRSSMPPTCFISDRLPAFFLMRIVLRLNVHPLPLHVSRSRSPLRTGVTDIDVNVR